MIWPFWIASCSSLAYSPVLNVPHSPLKKNEISIAGGAEMLAETRQVGQFYQPDTQKTAFGFSGQLGVGLKNNLAIYTRGWIEAEPSSIMWRHGYSLHTLISNPAGKRGRIHFIPRVGVVFFGKSISGWAAGASTAFQYNLSNKISLYSGSGILWAFAVNPNAYTPAILYIDRRQNNGIAYNFNNGLALKMGYGLVLNFEIVPSIHLNQYDKETQYVVASAIGLTYTF